MKLFCLVLVVLLVVSISWNVYQLNGNRQLTKQLTHLVNEKEEADNERDEAKDKIQKLEDQLADVEHFDSDDGPVQQGYEEGSLSFTGLVIATSVDGDFEGWSGDTIFKMTDGSIWQQPAYDYEYDYAYMPKVIIYRQGGSHYLEVEGVEDAIEVKRLK